MAKCVGFHRNGAQSRSRAGSNWSSENRSVQPLQPQIFLVWICIQLRVHNHALLITFFLPTNRPTISQFWISLLQRSSCDDSHQKKKVKEKTTQAVKATPHIN